ncbi:unnamed protein product [Owenia fusiformis]|uniref:N-acetyltransferase domain-containing protein n=1 Tax=Owenia fusiformis TaxID=6347 RepID=A0A8J1YD75_OWEFU|nr:unnamed protein product [Owenia fusiformis]
MMIGLLSREPPIKVKLDELEMRLFDPKKDNWKEVRNMAFTPLKETIPKIMRDLLFHPILSCVLAILAGVTYQIKGSLWSSLVLLVVIYPPLYIFLVWMIPPFEMSKQVDYNKFVEYWTDPAHPLWLLFHKRRLIGSVGLKELDVNTRGELVRLAIAHEYRRNGLAEKLVYTVIEFCEKHKYEELILLTSVYQLGAMKLYEKVGFTKYSRYTLYYITPVLSAVSVQIIGYTMKIPRK